MNKEYAVLDFETGSLNPNTGAIVSVGVLALDSELKEIDRYYSLVIDPDKEILQEALNVNGLTLEQILKNGKPIEEVLDKIHELIDGRIMVCHNAAFDCSFLRNKNFDIAQAIDTMLLSRRVFPKQPAKLSAVCMRFGIEVKDAHNSLGDVLLTAEALRKFAKSTWLNALEPKPIIFKV